MPEKSTCSSASACSKSSCEGCSGAASSQDMTETINQMSSVKKVIGIVSGKGGVGKSFVTASLAVAMRKAGYEVGIMDADMPVYPENVWNTWPRIWNGRRALSDACGKWDQNYVD